MTAATHPAPSEWPIAAAMINFAGTGAQDAPTEAWADTVQQVADAGFTHIDPTDSWVRVADLSPERRREFVEVIAAAGLRMESLSTARRSVIDPATGADNLAYSHRVIDTAAELGIGLVSFGLMRDLTPAQQQALWFWTVDGPADPEDDPAVWDAAVSAFRDLGDHAASVGVQVSLEMYEDTYLGTADSAVRLVESIDRPTVGLNPDLGNLLRLHRPVEHWRSMVDKVVPFANYWHVKNYYRIEDATTGTILTSPAPMEYGVIDYRYAVRAAIAAGFRGAFCTEHYGGDGLSVSATNREYLRRILPREQRA